ncbi:PB1 protein [Sinu virus]|uniref:RNA-directed RNA polymerase catalytic subunit n=1 Tax=Sinu virus TaxID=1927799 RepID=A0A1L5YKG1_9ORTO|nr:PB1 protein [Sinu virus]APP91612.1 PB1 protein [Sinu virus]
MDILTPFSQMTITECQELYYAYTGPPPVAYGSKTKAVLENIKRPYQYFDKHKRDDKDLDITIKSGKKDTTNINMEKPSSGYNEEWLIKFSKDFCVKHRVAFDNLGNWLDFKLPLISYAELAKGRQTWSFIQKRNIPAAMALEETVEFLEHNLKRRVGKTMLEYLQAICDVLELDETNFLIKKNKKGIDMNTEGEEIEFVPTEKIKIVEIKFTREELWDQMRKLNTMWKHFERGKLNRRTIATASMLVRGFVKITEDAARVLLERIDSAGTPVGGEEKLAKLASNLVQRDAEITGELSGDQEKFNECLDPDAMRTMWTVFLKFLNRDDWEIDLFNVPFMVFKAKLADMGEGLVFKSGKVKRHFHLNDAPENEFSCLKGLVRENDIECSLGMFMGMYNLTATLVALIAADTIDIRGKHVESSDDFIHFFFEKSKDKVVEQAEKLRMRMKLVGINFSPSKSVLIIPAGIGEFNSKFHHQDFVGNIATELPALIPGGNNPMTDMSMGLNVIKNSLNTFQMTPLTANFALKLFFEAYKYAYLINGETKRKRFIDSAEIKPLVTYQGAEPIHSISNIHLDEIALRHHLGLISEEELSIIMNPANPITRTSEPTLTVRVENKMPTVSEDPSLGSCFKFQFSRNRTILNTETRIDLKKEKEYQEMSKLVQDIFPEFMIAPSTVDGTVMDACKERIKIMILNSDVTEPRKRELLQLLNE